MVSAASGLQVEGGCSPQVGSERRKPKTGRHHADDCERLTIEGNRLADDVEIGVEVRCPAFIAQYYGMGAGTIVFEREGSTELRRYPEDLKKAARYESRVHSFRSST